MRPLTSVTWSRGEETERCPSEEFSEGEPRGPELCRPWLRPSRGGGRMPWDQRCDLGLRVRPPDRTGPVLTAPGSSTFSGPFLGPPGTPHRHITRFSAFHVFSGPAGWWGGLLCERKTRRQSPSRGVSPGLGPARPCCCRRPGLPEAGAASPAGSGQLPAASSSPPAPPSPYPPSLLRRHKCILSLAVGSCPRLTSFL